MFTLELSGLKSILFVTKKDKITVKNVPYQGARAISYENPDHPPFGIPGTTTQVGTVLVIATANFGGFVTALRDLNVFVHRQRAEDFHERIEEIFGEINADKNVNKNTAILQRLVDTWVRLSPSTAPDA